MSTTERARQIGLTCCHVCGQPLCPSESLANHLIRMNTPIARGKYKGKTPHILLKTQRPSCESLREFKAWKNAPCTEFTAISWLSANEMRGLASAVKFPHERIVTRTVHEPTYIEELSMYGWWGCMADQWIDYVLMKNMRSSGRELRLLPDGPRSRGEDEDHLMQIMRENFNTVGVATQTDSERKKLLGPMISEGYTTPLRQSKHIQQGVVPSPLGGFELDPLPAISEHQLHAAVARAGKPCAEEFIAETVPHIICSREGREILERKKRDVVKALQEIEKYVTTLSHAPCELSPLAYIPKVMQGKADILADRTLIEIKTSKNRGPTTSDWTQILLYAYACRVKGERIDFVSVYSIYLGETHTAEYTPALHADVEAYLYTHHTQMSLPRTSRHPSAAIQDDDPIWAEIGL